MLNIELHGPPRPFSPGDQISGNVTWTGQSFCSNLTVAFEGRAKTKRRIRSGNSDHVYRGRALLVIKTAQPKATINPGSGQTAQVFPFSFIVPTYVEDTRNAPGSELSETTWSMASYWDWRWEILNPFASAPGHFLPPTFHEQYESTSRRYYAVTYAIKAFAFVDEKKQVQERPVKILAQPVMEEALIGLQARARSESRLRQIIRTPKLLPENASVKVGFKDKMKILFESSSVPTFDYTACVKFPTHLGMGQGIPLEVKLEDVWPKAGNTITNITEEPQVVLRSIDLSIKADTDIRCSSTWNSHEYTETMRGAWTGRLVGDTFSSKNNYTLSFLSSPLPEGIPSFSTYNIVRRYTLKVTLHLLCAEKEHEAEVKQPVMCYLVRSPSTLPPQLEYAQSAATDIPDDVKELQGSTPVDKPGELPTYTEAVKA